MMCHEAKRQLDLFMDGELSVPDNMKVLEHLNLCRPCSEVYEGEKALRGALKSQLGAEKAPASVYAKLSRAASPAEVVEFPRKRWGAVAAAVFFLTLAAAMLFTPSVETAPAFAAVAASTHDSVRQGFCGHTGADRMCLCTNCCPDADHATARFFHKHVAYDVCEHDLRALGYAPTNAAVSQHRQASLCWTIYHDGKGHSISHALLATPVAMGDGPRVIRSCSHPVVMVPVPGRPGFTCVFIFDDPAALDRFLAAK